MASETLLVIDGTALVLRPWFAGRGRPATEARNVVRHARRQVSHCCVVVDRTLDTFRRELDPTYKAHRPLPPEELIAEFDRFEVEVAELGVPVFGDLRHEADDWAASLARAGVAAGLEVHLRAADKDLFQLVRDAPPAVMVVAPSRGWEVDEAEVEARLGVRPDQVVDYLALVGDSSDGVRGVRGVGAKTAAALLQALGSLDGIYARLDEVPGLPIRGARTLPGKLEAGHQDALLARRLVTLVDDLDLGPDALARCATD